jgi:hypothetical protein
MKVVTPISFILRKGESSDISLGSAVHIIASFGTLARSTVEGRCFADPVFYVNNIKRIPSIVLPYGMPLVPSASPPVVISEEDISAIIFVQNLAQRLYTFGATTGPRKLCNFFLAVLLRYRVKIYI